MKNQTNSIGLDPTQSEELAKKLNLLLANYSMFYMNLRGFHWNIKGKDFFELHAKFEELYNDSLLKIDEIAERILTLEHQPLHSYHEYASIATIKPAINITDGTSAVRSILTSYQTLLPIEREIMEIASTTNDEGSNALMSDYIREQEKLVWMLKAYVSE